MFQAGKHHPGMLIPFCGFCRLPVSRLRYRIPKEDGYVIEYEADCCDHTSGRKVTFEEMKRARFSGENLYLIAHKKQPQQFRTETKGAR